ncbi:MAG: YkgJ family cysteine cluster protein [Candidatus Bathyarchaeota archaeon]|nr:YkgJ family cysteine cluster protein [Candidatus Bathyarchaeota archaeon]
MFGLIETVYAHIEFLCKTPWSVNLPFVCTQCGICCNIEGFLTAGKLHGTPETDSEAHAKANQLYQDLGELWRQDPDKYDQHIQTTPCIFQKNNKCTIYPIRPDGCQQFPNTLFGMQSTDCPALNRFKTQLKTLKKGRKTRQTLLYTNQTRPIKPTKHTQKQHQNTQNKLQQTDHTKEELELFNQLNKNSA